MSDVAAFLGGLVELEHDELSSVRERHVDGISAFGRGKTWLTGMGDSCPQRITHPDWDEFVISEDAFAERTVELARLEGRDHACQSRYRSIACRKCIMTRSCCQQLTEENSEAQSGQSSIRIHHQ